MSPYSPQCTLFIAGMKCVEVMGKKVQGNVHLLNTKLGADSNSNATVAGLPPGLVPILPRTPLLLTRPFY